VPASRSGLRDFEYMAKALGLLSRDDSVSARFWCQEVAADSGLGLDQVPTSGYGDLQNYAA
jgi:hypothetical protein